MIQPSDIPDDSLRDAVQPAVEPAAVYVPTPPRVRAGWLAGADTLERLVRILRPLSIGMMDELVDITVFCPEGVDADELPSPPIEIVRIPQPGWTGWSTKHLENLAGVINGRKLTLLHALDATTADLTRRLARMTAMQYVISCYSLRGAREMGTLDRQAAAVLPASEPVRRALLDQHVAPSNRIRLIRPGVYQVEEATCFTDPQYSVTLVADGPLDDLALWEPVLRAYAELRNRNFDCAFFIIGNGSAEKRIRVAAEKLSLLNDLTFADSQSTSQLAGIFKAADVFISPVPSQEVDMHALLAMAAGTPVITATGGVNDFVIPGDTAVTFGAGGAMELTEKLLSLVEDKDSAKSLAERALVHLRRNHSAAGMVAAIATLYREILMTLAR